MVVHFYGVANCYCDSIEGRPVLIAPVGVDSESLQRHYFTALPDGRWAHYLTREEYYYIVSFGDVPEVVFSYDKPVVNYSSQEQPQEQLTAEEKKNADTLCIISIVLWAVCFVPFLAYVSVPCMIAALVLVIIARVKYPKHTFSKVLLIVYGVLFLVGMVLAVVTLIACGYYIEDSMKHCAAALAGCMKMLP